MNFVRENNEGAAYAGPRAPAHPEKLFDLTEMPYIRQLIVFHEIPQQLVSGLRHVW